jgi:hypothetical protein
MIRRPTPAFSPSRPSVRIVERDGAIDGIEGGLVESRWVEQRIGHPVIKAFNNICAPPPGARQAEGRAQAHRPAGGRRSMTWASIQSTPAASTSHGARSPARRSTPTTLTRPGCAKRWRRRAGTDAGVARHAEQPRDLHRARIAATDLRWPDCHGRDIDPDMNASAAGSARHGPGIVWRIMSFVVKRRLELLPADCSLRGRQA